MGAQRPTTTAHCDMPTVLNASSTTTLTPDSVAQLWVNKGHSFEPSASVTPPPHFCSFQDPLG